MIRKAKLFSRPKKKYELLRIKEENVLMEKYGLKNKREIWKSLAKVTYFRHRAKDLARKSNEEQQVFFNKLNAIGLKVSSISDVLALTLESLLERRLPTVVARKGFASTPQQARQMVVHKKVMIENKVNNTPSYIVPVALESHISVRHNKKAPKAEKKEESQSPAEETK